MSLAVVFSFVTSHTYCFYTSLTKMICFFITKQWSLSISNKFSQVAIKDTSCQNSYTVEAYSEINRLSLKTLIIDNNGHSI